MPTVLLIWFVAYVGLCLKKFGMTDSISDTWYEWLEVKQSRMFVGFCAGLALGLIGVIESHKMYDKAGLAIAVAAFSAFAVAVAANFRYGQKERANPANAGKHYTRVDIIHYLASGLLIGGCLIGLWIRLNFWYVAVFTIGTIGILVAKKLNRKVSAIWAIEVWAFAVIDYGFYQL